MPGIPPRKPSGESAEARYAKHLYDRVENEARLGQVSGQRTQNTTGGKMVVPSRARGGGGSSSVQTLKLRFVEDDYLVCREWDGTTIGTEDIYVLKPEKLKCSIADSPAWIAGTPDPTFGTQTYTYAQDSSEPYMEYGETVPDSDPASNEWGETSDLYDGGELLANLRLNTVRTVTNDGNLEDQRVIPLWMKGDIIYAAELEDSSTTTTGFITTSGQSIDLVDLNADARTWARI
jgi:hypothetical protein